VLRPLHLGAALLLSGCLPDFSPDPINTEDDVEAKDGGADAGDAGAARDAARPRDAALLADAARPDAASAAPDASPPPASGCDLSGHYLLTERLGLDGLGAKQTNNNWYYVELTQSGSTLTFAKSVSCGVKTEGAPPLQVTVDDKRAWPAYMAQATYAGRKGTVEEGADGCAVTVERASIVRGATVEAYRDVSVPLPKLAQQATESEPGWEDWDEDGHPGVSLRISGIAQGVLYAATRSWSEYAGDIEPGASTFSLGITWNQTRSTLGYEGSSLLTSDAVPDSDRSLHVAEFARLSEEQAAGDDATRCERLRELAPTLTPNAMRR
jgi:hypothetical protein